MEEQQALLGRGVRSSFVTSSLNESSSRQINDYQANLYDDGGGSSSDGSDSWWGDSHSSCSSCTGSASSEEDWESEVTEEGELLFVEPMPSDDRPIDSPPDGSKSDAAAAHNQVISPNKFFNVKEGKFVRWIRRRESKRQRPRLSLVSEQNTSAARSGITAVILSLPLKNDGPVDVSAIGLQLTTGDDSFAVVRSIHPDGPLAGNSQVSVGDILKTFNGDEVSFQTFENRLAELVTPCQIVLGFQKRKGETNVRRGSVRSKLVQRLIDGDLTLESKIAKTSIAVLVLNIGESRDEAPDGDLVFCYPSQSVLSSARGAFLTLNHLMPSFVDSECTSCTCQINDEDVHIVFIKEDDLLFLLALPESICRMEDVCHLGNDIVRCLQFNHQTLQCCFQKDVKVHQKFLSSVFSRLLSKNETVGEISIAVVDSIRNHFHDYLSCAAWVPLPREAQLQLDDALNELEACDFGHGGEEAVESERLYIVLGSCLYHQGYLLASHLTKEDLLDVHSFLRQHGLLELSRVEGLNRLVIWTEVYPHSVNRGLPPTLPAAYSPPVGRWFLLVVSTGQDILGVLLESAGCCLPLPRFPRPHVPHVREAEDTLAHIQSLGLTNMVAQWIACRARPRTTAEPPPSFKTLVKDKHWLALPRNSGDIRVAGGGDIQEDCSSQTTSNPSNTSNASESDENAPILGRRAERTAIAPVNVIPAREQSDDSHSDASDSDSDWGSFKGLNIQDNGSGLFDNPYLPSNVGDLEDITPSKVTAGRENFLYHFVYIDGNEGIVVTPGGEATPPSDLMNKFTEAAHSIHAQLQHNVRFRSATNPRGVVHKSLVAIKECGVRIDVGESGKSHWVVGRLFFTPKPREIYVCYCDDAPQNMLELSFRFGLNVAG